MSRFLSGFVRGLARSLAFGTIGIACVLVYAGRAGLIGALLAGYAAGAVCIGTLIARTWKSAHMSAAAAKQQMLWGLLVRLGTCFIVLAVAGNIGRDVFAFTAFGLLFFYALGMGHLVYAARHTLDEK